MKKTVLIGFAIVCLLWFCTACGSSTTTSSQPSPTSSSQFPTLCNQQQIDTSNGTILWGAKCSDHLYVVTATVTNGMVSDVSIEHCILQRSDSVPGGTVWWFKSETGYNVFVSVNTQQQVLKSYESPPGGPTTIPL